MMKRNVQQFFIRAIPWPFLSTLLLFFSLVLVPKTWAFIAAQFIILIGWIVLIYTLSKQKIDPLKRLITAHLISLILSVVLNIILIQLPLEVTLESGEIWMWRYCFGGLPSTLFIVLFWVLTFVIDVAWHKLVK